MLPLPPNSAVLQELLTVPAQGERAAANPQQTYAIQYPHGTQQLCRTHDGSALLLQVSHTHTACGAAVLVCREGAQQGTSLQRAALS